MNPVFSSTDRHPPTSTTLDGHRAVKIGYHRKSPTPDRRTRIRSGRTSPVRECNRPSSSASACEPDHQDSEGRDFNDWIACFRPTYEASTDSKSLLPPITATTLGELEVSQVVSNSRLRHDVNFDRELHFRPNLDGSRGQEKLSKAAKYWQSLQAELEEYTFLLADPRGADFRWTERWTKQWKSCQQRVPAMFTAIKDILMSLMPERDHAHVREVLDVKLILQQVEHFAFDISGFGQTLAKLLKAHCAPMRDPWVDRMAEQMGKGGALFEAHEIVEGLKELFGVLEAMKLVSLADGISVKTRLLTTLIFKDIANHQIRYLHPMLVENTIPFEQIFQKNKIQINQVDVLGALDWYRSGQATRILENTLPVVSRAEEELANFTTALVSSMFPLLPRPLRPIPDTFKLDQERLCNICNDVLHAINMESCGTLLKLVMSKLNSSSDDVVTAVNELPGVLSAFVGQRANESAWTLQSPNIAAEIVRLATSNMSSNGIERFEMLRYVDACETLLDKAFRLESSTKHESAAAQNRIRKALLSRVWNSVQEHKDFGPAGLFDALVSAPVKAKPNQAYYASSTPTLAYTAVPVPEVVGNLDDIARRITHIALLHWKVWKPLVYVRETEVPAIPDLAW